jgi:hypothetical protein
MRPSPGVRGRSRSWDHCNDQLDRKCWWLFGASGNRYGEVPYQQLCTSLFFIAVCLALGAVLVILDRTPGQRATSAGVVDR